MVPTAARVGPVQRIASAALAGSAARMATTGARAARGGRASMGTTASRAGACGVPLLLLSPRRPPLVTLSRLHPSTLSTWTRPIVTGIWIAGALADESSPSPPPHTPPPSRLPTHHTCPACGQRCVKPGVFERHLGSCCPDLVPRAAWRAAVEAGNECVVLAAAAAVEGRLRAEAVRLAFRDTHPTSGAPIRRSPQEVASVLGLPVPRVSASLKLAMRAVPLAVDEEPVDVIFEDDHLIAFSKPAGLITAPKHRYTGGSLVNRAIAHLKGTHPYPVHRLDMFTSGVVVMGKSGPAAAGLNAQFRERTAVKRYLALVVGRLGGGEEADSAGAFATHAIRHPSYPPGAFAVAAPIGRYPGHDVARAAVGADDPEGAPSLTLFRPVAVSARLDDSSALAAATPAPLAPPGTLASLSTGATLLCAAPRTGRTHQIRVHATAAGHPLVGDDLYGALVPWAPRQLLHAATLDLDHPITGHPLHLAAPLPPDFLSALARVGLSVPADLASNLPVMDGWGPAPPC